MSLQSSASGALAATLLVCSLASAQPADPLPGFDLERLETNTGRGTILVGNGELLVPGGLSVNLLGHYQRMPLVLNDGEKDLQIVRDRATTLLAASYGVLPWLEVGAQIPFVLWQQGDDPSDVGLARLSSQGLGTPVLQARLELMSRSHRQIMDMAADIGVGLPIGSGGALAADTGPRFHARLTAGTAIGWVQPSLEAGVLFRPGIPLATLIEAAKPGARSEIRLAASVTTTGKGQRGELSVRATLSPQVSMDVLGGIRFPLFTGLDAFLLGGPGVGGALGAPRFRMLAGITFRSEPPPKLSFLNDRDDRELQLTMAAPKPPQTDERVKPVSTWELNQLTREEGQETSAIQKASKEPLRPYQPSPREKVVLRGSVSFARGSAELQGMIPLLDQVVLQLSDLPNGGAIIIEGHANYEGSDSSDMFVSLQRAQAVRRYLVNQGISAALVRIRGLSSDWPVSPRPINEEERQLNRRAEVLLLTEAPQLPSAAKTPAP